MHLSVASTLFETFSREEGGADGGLVTGINVMENDYVGQGFSCNGAKRIRLQRLGGKNE